MGFHFNSLRLSILGLVPGVDHRLSCKGVTDDDFRQGGTAFKPDLGRILSVLFTGMPATHLQSPAYLAFDGVLAVGNVLVAVAPVEFSVVDNLLCGDVQLLQAGCFVEEKGLRPQRTLAYANRLLARLV